MGLYEDMLGTKSPEQTTNQPASQLYNDMLGIAAPAPDDSLLSGLGRGFKAGAAGTIGGIADFAEANLGVGQSVGDWGTAVARENQAAKQYSIAERIPFVSDYWTNAAGAAHDIGQAAGSSVTLLPLTAAIGAALPETAVAAGAAGVSRVLGAAGLKKLAQVASGEAGKDVVKWATAGALGKIPEAASEGGSLYRDMLAEGYMPEQAKSAANTVALKNIPLLMAEGAVEMTGLTGKLGKAMGVGAVGDGTLTRVAKNAAFNVPLQAGTEGATELKQTMISNEAAGRPHGSFFSPSTWTPDEEAALGAGLVGGGVFGAAGALHGLRSPNAAAQQGGSLYQDMTGEQQTGSNGVDTLIDKDKPDVVNTAVFGNATMEDPFASETESVPIEIQQNIRRGQEAMKAVIEQQTDVVDAMQRPDLGSISLYWGDEKGGIRHIIERRTAQGYDGRAIAEKMVDVIAQGEAGSIYGPEGGQRVNISHAGHTAVLSLYKIGNKQTWLLTGWENYKEAPNAPGEGYGSRGATQSEPMRTRPGLEETSYNSTIPPVNTNVNGREFMAASGGRGVPVGGSQIPTGGAPVSGTVTRRQILSRIDAMFTPVRTGRLGVRNALGGFNPQSEIARSKSFGDFQTAMHEIGHYVDHQIGLRQNPAFDGELISFVRRNFGNAYDHLPPDRLRAEGIAEFFREYTTDRNQAAQNFPGYYRAFESRMQQVPEIKSKIEDISGLLHTWYNQAPEARVKGSISFGDRRTLQEKGWGAVKHPAETAKALVENGRKAFDTAYDQFVDQLAPLDRMMREIEQATGQKLPLAQDVFKQAWLTRGWAGKAEALIKKGAPGVPALEKIIKTVEHDYEGFSAYVVALREMDAYRLEATTGAKFEHAITQADAARTVAKYRQDPKFISAQQDLVKFNNHLLDMLVESGLKDRETVELYRQKWPNYVPFFREFNDAAVEKFLGTKGFGNVSNPIKKFEGSTRDILSPVESIVKNVYQFTNLAERNKVGRLFVDLAQKPGLGKLIEEVSGSASSKDSTFGVWVNGTKKVFQTEPELYRAIMLLDRESASWMVKALQFPASLLRAGAVLSPEFIARNPVRDAFTAFVNSKYGFIPGIDTARGIMHLWNKDALYWEYQRSGAAHAAMVSMDRDYLAKGVREIMKKTAVQKAVSVINPKTYVDILRTFSEATEVATRLAEYENARRGYTGVTNRLFGSQRRSASMQEAALASRDVTLDFSRSGVKGKDWNKITAFWNASIQGTDKMIRSFKEAPVRTSVKVFMSITLPSIALYYMNRDDERYQELPQWQKDLFWIIPTKDTLIKIPKPFEVGILFGTSVERMLQWMDEKERGNSQATKTAFKGFGETVRDAFVPGALPTALIPLLEWYTNYSFFMDRNIVPPSQSKLPDKLQYGPNTSAIGKAIGDSLNVSPAKVDNSIRGYTGGLGGLGLFVGDVVAGEFDKRPEMRRSEWPGIRAFTAIPYRSSQSVQEFYDRFGEQEKLYNEWKQTKARPAEFNPAEYQRLKAVSQIMQEIHKAEKQILNHPTMASAEKRNRLDQLKVQAVNYARAGLGNKTKVAQ